VDQASLSDFLEPYIAEPGVFQSYLTSVAQGPFRRFKDTAQWGKKAGESLYTHILNGVMLLEQLHPLVGLEETETRLLFTAYTLHDLNKFEDTKKSYGDLATPANTERFIKEFGLDVFFPDYQRHLDAIVEVMRAHPGHYNWDARRLDLTRPFEGISQERLALLIALVRAADNLDLSHTLDERHTHKDKFLSEFNAACTTTQYAFFTHRLTEHRGLFSNIIHNSISNELRERCGLRPLLLYPEGTAYLMEKNAAIPLDEWLLPAIARRVAATLQEMTSERFEQFIVPRPLGITIDAKCLELGLPFRTLMGKVRTIIERRQPDPDDLRNKIRERTERKLKDLPASDQRQTMAADLLGGELLIPTNAERLRAAEALRTYYIFLNEHFKAAIADSWQRLYDLFQIPQEWRPLYDLFDARLDRAYVVINAIALPSEALWERILDDGSALLDQHESSDARIPLLTDYLQQVVRFGTPQQQRPEFANHLKHYIANQHHQCVHCSSGFPTSGWLKGDVRSEISVNTFSNRLAGGPGEPKKYVCGICQIQFLVEKLAFKEVRGEQIYYLHLFPYSFLPSLLVDGIRAQINRANQVDETAQALFLRPEEYLARYDPKEPLEFVTQTKKGKPHTYGVYLPSYSETVGNLLIEPLNAPGDNDTERFIFVLQMAMLLQKHLGLKALVSLSPVPPLDKEAIGDLYLDLRPLGLEGLLESVDFRSFEDGDKPGNLQPLWNRMQAILRLRRHLGVIGERDPMVELARALTVHPLEVFFVAERLLENRLSKGSSSAFLRIKEARELLPDLEMLAQATKGVRLVEQVSSQLKRLAGIAWLNGLRGRSLEKHSLMVPFDECMNQLSHTSQAFETDEDAIRATAITEIFEYLKRIAPEGYKPGAKKQQACEEFVDIFFTGLYRGVYQGSKPRLLNDERRLRAAFLFYLRKQIQDYFDARKRGVPASDDDVPPIDEESA
jgi:CRISPR-associated protein Csc3